MYCTVICSQKALPKMNATLEQQELFIIFSFSMKISQSHNDPYINNHTYISLRPKGGWNPSFSGGSILSLKTIAEELKLNVRWKFALSSPSSVIQIDISVLLPLSWHRKRSQCSQEQLCSSSSCSYSKVRFSCGVSCESKPHTQDTWTEQAI